jgi:photosystem II stability/assembly factor-like uncharacterized protein
MKRSLILFFTLFCLSSYSQEEWEQIHSSDSIYNIYNVFMIDSTHAWGHYAHDLYFSKDFGESWEFQYRYEPSGFVDSYFIDTLNGWFCGDSGVIRTTDGGKTWSFHILPNEINGLNMYSIFFINRDTGWVVGACKSIFVTYDGGDNWNYQHYLDNTGYFFLYDIQFYDELHGCAVGGGLLSGLPFIMTTEDGGETWKDFYPPGDEKLNNVEFVNEFEVWTCDNIGKLFYSYDRGFTWELFNQIYVGDVRDMHFFNENEAIMAGGMIRMAVTDDGWNHYQIAELYGYNSITDFSFGRDKKGIAYGYNNMLRTIDGGHTWSRLNDRFIRIAFFNPSNGWLIQEYLNKNLLHSADGGFTWNEVETGHRGTFHQMDFISDQVGFALTDDPELLKTTDAGSTWEILNIPFDSTYFSDLLFLDENTGFICAWPNTLLKTLNGGTDWEIYSFDTLNHINSADFINAEEGWVVGSQGFAAHTRDGGNSWEISTFPSYGLIDVDFVNNLTGYILSYYGIYKTNNGGVSWEEVLLDLMYPEDIIFHDTLNGWITDENRVYRTYDGGESWIETLFADSHSFEHQITDIFALDTLNAWVCTMDGRVFSLSGLQSTDEIKEPELISIYPNPVSDKLTIEINNEIKDNMTIRIFSIDGKLMLSRQYSGLNQDRLILDLSNFSSGLYLLNCQGSSVSKSYKLVKE